MEFAREPNGGLIVTPNGLAIVHRALIIDLAARYKLPAIYPFRYFAESGGLLAYGPEVAALSRLDFHDHATVDLVGAHAAEDAVDVFQPFRRVVDLHLAVAGELQALGEIESRPHDRSPNGLAHQNGVKDVQLERTRWQPNEDHGASLAEHSESLAERF